MPTPETPEYSQEAARFFELRDEDFVRIKNAAHHPCTDGLPIHFHVTLNKAVDALLGIRPEIGRLVAENAALKAREAQVLLERDSARDQFDRHVEWASKEHARLIAQLEQIKALPEQWEKCADDRMNGVGVFDDNWPKGWAVAARKCASNLHALLTPSTESARGTTTCGNCKHLSRFENADESGGWCRINETAFALTESCSRFEVADSAREKAGE